jgi:phage terminase large subunit-like protein
VKKSLASSASSKARKRRKTEPGDYVGIAIAYAEEAIEDRGQERFGKWIRLAAKRFIGDLKATQKKRPPFFWSASQANQACEFIEALPHVEGDWGAENLIRLEPSQVFFIVNLFGFRRADGTRRFTTALFAVARKNAKSTLAAAILLYSFCCEHETGPQILSAATTGDQARIVWGVAKRMIEKVSDLRETFGLEPWANAIARYENGGTFKPINAKASTQDGLNPSGLCFDELHAHKTRDLFDVLRSAAGARKNPLFLYTTTEGYENPGPWAEVRSFAHQVLEKIVEADHFLAVYYALDEKDNDFDESKWVKANPLLGVSVTIEKLREYAKEAKAQPGALAEFQIKRLNRRAASSTSWISLPKWRRCGGPIVLEELVGRPCWAGLDLANTRDMCAWRLLWLVDGVYYTWGRYWVPSSAVEQRNERGTIRYAPWVQAGYITQTDGDVTDYDVVKRDVLADWARFQPSEIAFDQWNAVQLVSKLIDEGMNMVEFRQGPKSYHPAMQAFERAYVSKQLRHDENPVLSWNVANLVAKRDENLNMAPDKKRSADKIDGIVALLMAFGRAAVSQPTGPAFVEL